MTIAGYLGIDNGTQGLSVVFTDENLKVLATGEGSYDFIEGLEEGCYEQRPEDWDAALQAAMKAIHQRLPDIKVMGIGIAGQMHGEVLVGEDDRPLAPVRLWCDARNDAEGHELTQALGCKMAKRATATRFLWTARNRPQLAAQTRHLTTPAGWMAFTLTGEWNLGIGDAAGMFPIDPATLDYNQELLERYDEIVDNRLIPRLSSILPCVRKAGEDAGSLTKEAAAWLGLAPGIPVAAGEGDQVAALAGSLIGRAGMIGCSFGTSVCANVIGDRPFVGVSPAVDHFCAADGKPILMVWLRNGTTFLNTMVESYAEDKANAFATVMPELIAAPPDCGGLLALPFMDDEPGLQVERGGTALLLGLSSDNATPGNIAKAALLSTMFNLRLGCEILDAQGYPRTAIGLSGGLVKTPECGQIVADVFATEVNLLASAEEGCSWGAAVLAKYRHVHGDYDDWPSFLDAIEHGEHRSFVPDPAAAEEYKKVYQRYKELIRLQPELAKVMSK